MSFDQKNLLILEPLVECGPEVSQGLHRVGLEPVRTEFELDRVKTNFPRFGWPHFDRHCWRDMRSAFRRWPPGLAGRRVDGGYGGFFFPASSNVAVRGDPPSFVGALCPAPKVP